MSLLLLLPLAVSGVRAQGGPIGEQPAAQAPPDTAGSRLRAVWTKARQSYPGALLLSISGKTEAAGSAVCSPDSPFQDGWRYTFYSPKKEEYLMMAECGGAIAGPLVQLMARETGQSQFDIKGRFIDSDAAMQTLAKSGVSLDPADHKGGTRRPFALSLYRIEDDRYPDHPLVWKVVVGEDSYLIDGNDTKRFMGTPTGQAGGVELSSAAAAAQVLAARPERKGVNTARSNFENMLHYAQQQYPGARLMAIEGFVDAWGGSPCTGAGDGWYFYFYHPKSRGFKVLLDCKGRIGPGPAQYIPVDVGLHQPIDGAGPFVDSDAAVDSALVQRPSSMNEGLGRKFTRHGELLLLNYRASPFTQQGLWKTTLIWQLKLGTTLFKMDATNGKVIDITE